MNGTSFPYARSVVEPIGMDASVDSAVVNFSQNTDQAILGTYLEHETYGRFSVFACDPAAMISIRSNRVACPFRALARYVAAYPSLSAVDAPVPFLGGWIGFITYEAGLTIEGIPCVNRRDMPLPFIRFGLYDAAAVYDHRARQWYTVAVDWPEPFAHRRPAVKDRLASIRRLLERAAAIAPAVEPAMPSSTPAVPNVSHHAYISKVRQAKDYIVAGDIYQVNLAQRFTTHTEAPPVDIYRRLGRSNPAPYAALIASGDTAILSSSPELFLRLRDGHVITRPIKGTRPRGADAATDAANRLALVESEKDRAELTMIIDLLRNDLGRVCIFGTVRVTSADDIEAHPTVFHRVATIEGDLRPDRNWVDLLLATFPGGSVTGAPKIRAMQIIHELEPMRRGVYCGAIGWIGLDGSMCLNLAIRTMVQRRNRVHVYAGGAIVADSDPEAEHDEIIAKSAGMLQALGCGLPGRTCRRHRAPPAPGADGARRRPHEVPVV